MSVDNVKMKNEDLISFGKTTSLSTVEKSSNQKKNSVESVKLPYPVLSDHRELSSVLLVLQKETQSTSKKIIDVSRQIENCEKHLISTSLNDQEKKRFKSDRIKFKQQLDILKKHERRVSLQIDYITTKTEIKGLEDERKQIENNEDLGQKQQIEILLGKLKQKLDKMKIYMQTRNEQMKKQSNGKNKNCSTGQKSAEQNCSLSKTFKRSVSSNSQSSISSKRSRTNVPVVGLTSRTAGQDSKKQSNRTMPVVRFLNKTSESRINSTSPTTPASSSSTLSSPLVTGTSTMESHRSTSHEEKFSNNDDEQEFDSDLDVDDLFVDEDNTSNSCFD